MVSAGLIVLDHGLDRIVAEARDRAMPLLEVDARIARGMLSAGQDKARAASDLQKAATIADQAGDRLRGGRARLEWAQRAETRPAVRIGLLTEALTLLADHVPLAARTRALLD